MAGILNKQTFEVYKAKFKEVTGLNADEHPEAFMSFINIIQTNRLMSKIDLIATHLGIELES